MNLNAMADYIFTNASDYNIINVWNKLLEARQLPSNAPRLGELQDYLIDGLHLTEHNYIAINILCTAEVSTILGDLVPTSHSREFARLVKEQNLWGELDIEPFF